ncbi:sensor histidine kinase KdpD [uncultured Bacteroides sp.]|uniref:sensor histidine kinase n=1 Tax=uncultured Bacteroides sp. TaxID=162156 RepID=UPI0025CCDE32|nr:HAMP domain-containing sensor histidine kinase [uncultured Bacteroides sp.]
MKRNTILTAIIFSFLLVLQMRADEPMKFDSDSIPPAFTTLKNLLFNPTEYYLLWYKMKKEIDAKGGDNAINRYYLYKDRVLYHCEHSQLDSLRKYVPILKDLCLKVGDEYCYYQSWDILCDFLLFSNLEAEAIAEHQKMQADASQRKSKIGLAFSTSRIGISYATRKEFDKAQPYIEQSMKVFEEMKCWDDYVLLAYNYIIVLLQNGKKNKALSTFLHLDSIANSFIANNDYDKHGRNILIIKDMASEVYSQLYKEPKDTLIQKKYLDEMIELYKKAPNQHRIHLYNSKVQYATITKNYPELIAYQDSIAQYNIKTDNKVGLLHTYYYMSENLFTIHKYKDAYLTLHKYVELNDSIYKDDFQKQLSEMSTRYNVNKLELEAQKMRMVARNTQYYYACALIIILAVALLISIRFYLHKLKSNRILRKQAEELILANQRVQKAQLVKSAFIQNMNHEIRTPLNAIVGFSDCLAAISMEPEEIQEMSATIKKNSDNLLKIITDTITIAHIDSDESMLNYQCLSLDTFFSGLILEMGENAQQGVNLHYTQGETDYTLLSDKSVLHQILYNLIHNALKFTQSGEVEVSYGVDESKKELSIYVRDTGPGINIELKEKIFERFYKVDDFAQGAGLGLSLCSILAERLGARIYLDDNYYEGCLFVLVHPIK